MASSQETNERAARLVGTMLRDKWRLDALIGVGGMAAVYAATHRNGKRAAIKLLSHDLSDGQATRTRFLREGYVANKVGHPGVVNVLDDDTSEDGRAFLVMELLEGETLKARWMRWKGRMPVQDVLHIAYQLLDVLAAAHDKGIVHRDIKPDNVFLTNDGALKVLDFGVARLRETETAADVTRSTAMLGTPAFMAPEQARSRWEWVDVRTDVWAVGATMFTALTGQFVHTATTVTELLITAAMQQARPINSVLPDLPESIASIIDRALAFDQAQRWPDARSMQSAIGLALQTALGFPGQPQPVARPMQAPAS
ncbi:MAG TPA: serine/threonine-protein kinase, partial [Polyangium sp.]|nr:serine/threonine-protein kinase [Polyangium sp.]